ncbi:MAG TPA: Zn-ribbon domain-containing OB-fold protein [Acidimicrobiia bacterium]|nr:Zn-ribbon domain-containing OB-fold protein [Acidimicrobiia bacterium]
MSAAHPRPDPVAADDARFWDSVAAGELRIQRCAACGTCRHPPRPVCAACGSTAQEWVRASGRGEVWAAAVIHPPTLPAFAARTPYGAVVVRLDEGVFMVGNVLDCPPEAVAVGMPVEVEITDVEPGLRLPLFRVAR